MADRSRAVGGSDCGVPIEIERRVQRCKSGGPVLYEVTHVKGPYFSRITKGSTKFSEGVKSKLPPLATVIGASIYNS